MRDQEGIVNVLVSRWVRALPLVAPGAAFTYLTPHFLTAANLLNVLQQMAEVSIIAVGMTALIVAAVTLDKLAGWKEADER